METHDRPGFPAWLAVLLMFALAAGVGVFTYNLGLEQGAAQAVPVAAAPGATAPPVVFYRPFHWHGGFAFAPFLGLFWIFLMFALIRRVFWWGPRWGWRRRYYGYYGCGPWDDYDYWYRRGPYGPYGPQGPQGPQGQTGPPPPPTTTQL